MKISILTPAYNAGAYLERAIQSVLAQSDPDFEHIVVDGGSSDETLSILRKYPHLKWLSEPDHGQCDAMNKAFAMCSGDVVTYLNADDWFELGAFGHVREMFQVQPGADIVVGNLYERYANSAEVRLVVPVKTYRAILLHFCNDFPLNPVCYFYRRSVQERVGPFPHALHYTMDYWFLLRAFMFVNVCCSGMVLGTFYYTGFNKTSHAHPTERPCNTAIRHLREDNSRLLPWYLARRSLYFLVADLPELIKVPMRYLAYRLFFTKIATYQDYKILGFRRAFRMRYPRPSSQSHP